MKKSFTIEKPQLRTGANLNNLYPDSYRGLHWRYANIVKNYENNSNLLWKRWKQENKRLKEEKAALFEIITALRKFHNVNAVIEEVIQNIKDDGDWL